MPRSTADQIITRIANANGMAPALMRQYIENALHEILTENIQPYSFMLEDLFPNGAPTVDAFVEALEYELYEAMMPTLPGWEWDGSGYRNISL